MWDTEPAMCPTLHTEAKSRHATHGAERSQAGGRKKIAAGRSPAATALPFKRLCSLGAQLVAGCPESSAAWGCNGIEEHSAQLGGSAWQRSCQARRRKVSQQKTSVKFFQ